MIEAGSLIRSLSGRPAARNFHTFVINEIGHGIVTGLFPVGSILASDAVMMETYGVSRTVLREALKTLEAKGLVEARPKVGTRVSPASRWNFFDPQVLAWHYYRKPDPHFYENLFSVRGALELEASREAVRHRTAEHRPATALESGAEQTRHVVVDGEEVERPVRRERERSHDDEGQQPLQSEVVERRPGERDVSVVRRVERAAEEPRHSNSTESPGLTPAARSSSSVASPRTR